ncbi:MAG: DUF493 domain-containing protein [Verrucomicrobiota bacterium]
MSDFSKLAEKLNETHKWPCIYVFKCVIPAKHKEQFEAQFADYPSSHRASSSGKYLSFTLEFEAHSSDQVIGLYQSAAKIPGAILL